MSAEEKRQREAYALTAFARMGISFERAMECEAIRRLVGV